MLMSKYYKTGVCEGTLIRNWVCKACLDILSL